MNAIEIVDKYQKWTQDQEVEVVTVKGVRFTLFINNALDGTLLVAPRMLGKKRKAWMVYRDFATTNGIANWLDSLKVIAMEEKQ